MTEIIQIKSPVIGVISDSDSYVGSRNQIDELAKNYDNLIVADMPMVIHSLINQPELRSAIRPGWVDTLTSEYHGKRDNNRFYEIWHSVGSLANAKSLEKYFSKADKDGFIPISKQEWDAVGKGNYKGEEIARFHLDDIKRGYTPPIGKPYTIFTSLDQDFQNAESFGQLNYTAFMYNDRILMIAGSLENREGIAKLFFGKKENGGEGLHSFANYHKISESSFNQTPKGRSIYLNDNSFDGGVVGDNTINIGKFLAVNKNLLQDIEIDLPEMSNLTLEQVILIINKSRTK